VTRAFAKRELGLLAEKGILVMEGERRGARYRAGLRLRSDTEK